MSQYRIARGALAAAFAHFTYMGVAHAESSSTSSATSSPIGQPQSSLQLRAHAELGFVAPVSHTIQFSKNGSKIDYVDEGGQDVLFPFGRLAMTLNWSDRHSLDLLYQPLLIESRATAERDLRVDDEVFAEGTPMLFRYSFPFWRMSYTYSVVQSSCWRVGLGGGLQIRNATIEFQSLDGEQFRSNRDVGPVPLLRLFVKRAFGDAAYLEGEVDGFYAPIKYINGGSSDVVGAIWDASLRAGLNLRYDTEAFVNLRYLGGGAEGTGDDEGPGDGYTSNWLHLVALTLGARAQLL